MNNKNKIKYKYSLTDREIHSIKESQNLHIIEAKKRNARRLCLIFFVILIFLFIVSAVVSFVSLSISRLDAVFGLNLFFTISIGLVISIIAVVEIICVFGSENLWPLFDEHTQSNFPQQIRLHCSVLCAYFIMTLTMWCAYGKAGSDISFGSRHGNINGFSNLVQISCSFLAIIEIVQNIYSYYKISSKPQKFIISDTINSHRDNEKGFILVSENGIFANKKLKEIYKSKKQHYVA